MEPGNDKDNWILCPSSNLQPGHLLDQLPLGRVKGVSRVKGGSPTRNSLPLMPTLGALGFFSICKRLSFLFMIFV
jgi:hypothetical protein